MSPDDGKGGRGPHEGEGHPGAPGRRNHLDDVERSARVEPKDTTKRRWCLPQEDSQSKKAKNEDEAMEIESVEDGGKVDDERKPSEERARGTGGCYSTAHQETLEQEFARMARRSGWISWSRSGSTSTTTTRQRSSEPRRPGLPWGTRGRSQSSGTAAHCAPEDLKVDLKKHGRSWKSNQSRVGVWLHVRSSHPAPKQSWGRLPRRESSSFEDVGWSH